MRASRWAAGAAGNAPLIVAQVSHSENRYARRIG